MKPPRYKLREFMIRRYLRNRCPGRFLEIGYGAGDLMLELAARGFSGSGVETSADAREECMKRLTEAGIQEIKLLDDLSTSETYDYVFFFEVVGYWPDPHKEIRRLKGLLNPGGSIVFSFTNARNAGIAEERTGNMRCFTRREIEDLMTSSGYKVEVFWNYGFPLSNLLRPLLNLYHRFGSQKSTDASVAMGQSGLRPKSTMVKFASFILNALIVGPACWIQLLFVQTERGTGYIVGATASTTK